MIDELISKTRQLPVIYSLRSEDLPEIVNLEVGDSRYVVMKLEMINKRSGKAMGLDGKDENKLEADFQINSVRVLGKEPVNAKSLESKEFTEMVNKVRSGEM